jgi:uncharacterized protein YeaO (DUF488 family)
MVDAGERHSDQAQSQEKSHFVKFTKTTSLRTQQAVARYGKAAGHPLCLAALDLWRLNAEVSKWTKEIVLFEELVKRTKQMKENAQALIKQFHKERNEKEANQVSALLRKIDNHLRKAQTRYQAAVKLRSLDQELRRVAVARFERERDAALCAGKKGALRALQRLRKRWSAANEASLKDGNLRQLEMLNMLRVRVKEAKWAKGEAVAGYWEALRGGDRPLSDEEWQGRLTAREIHSHIAATRGLRVAADKDAKETRRLARKLLLRLAEDQRGRKRKWPYPPKQEPKQPRGRPPTEPDVRFTGNLEAIEARKVAAERGKTPVRGG